MTAKFSPNWLIWHHFGVQFGVGHGEIKDKKTVDNGGEGRHSANVIHPHNSHHAPQPPTLLPRCFTLSPAYFPHSPHFL
jgi:hypothetical protein